MAFLPPGGPTEIVFSFDTTGSMSAILDEVTARLQDMIQRLQADIPGMKISVVAHGDYCDAEHFYVTKHIDFSDNIMELCNFVQGVGGTGGGDVPECYEFVLRLVREQLSWQPLSQKVLIMIGDAYPHEPDYPENVLNLDWKEELQALTKMGVTLYGVQVGEDKTSEDFFQTLSVQGGGQYLKLADFSNICTFIMAICYRERGEDFLQGFESEVRASRAVVSKDIEGLFGKLRRDDSKASSTGGCMGLLSRSFSHPVSPLPATISDASTSHALTAKKPRTVKPTTARKRTIVKPTGASKKAKCGPKKVQPKTLSTPKKAQLLREKVTDTNFALNGYKWSPWKLAMVPAADRPSDQLWRSIHGGKGARKQSLNVFKTLGKSPAFVEVSVQPRPRARRYVVMLKVVDSRCTQNNWYSVLFRNRLVRSEIENTFKTGCKIFIRVATRKQTVSAVRKEAKETGKLYSYAWHCHGRTGHRDLYLPRYGSLQISKSSPMDV